MVRYTPKKTQPSPFLSLVVTFCTTAPLIAITFFLVYKLTDMDDEMRRGGGGVIEGGDRGRAAHWWCGVSLCHGMMELKQGRARRFPSAPPHPYKYVCVRTYIRECICLSVSHSRKYQHTHTHIHTHTWHSYIYHITAHTTIYTKNGLLVSHTHTLTYVYICEEEQGRGRK